MPYDSASEYYRTYEGAPDSTLGAVTPLLSYPLGVPMSERAKRAQLRQAVRRLLAEGPGAMMGSTLLSVDAAELGDRALLDSLLPHSYQGHLRGPFLMLSETPTNDAVNFVTGAGGFLQQVIYGYTGLRLGDGGLEPPSRRSCLDVARLVLRNMFSRGRALRRRGGLHRPPAWCPARRGRPRDARRSLASRCCFRRRTGTVHAGPRVSGAGARRHRGVPGLPDPVLPRLARGMRCRSISTAERAGGAPLGRRGQREHRIHCARPGGAAGAADLGRRRGHRGRLGAARSLAYRLASAPRTIELGWFVLGSMRVERDFVYAGRQLKPFSAPPF